MLIRKDVPQPRQLRTRQRFVIFGRFHSYKDHIVRQFQGGEWEHEWTGEEKVTVVLQRVTVTEEYWRDDGWIVRQVQ